MEDKIFLHRFWEVYPDTLTIPEFAALKSKRGDAASSKIMWYIKFLNDPEHEYVGKLPRKDRDTLLVDYCGIKKSDLSSALFKAAEKWYVEKYMSAVKRVFMALKDKAEQMETMLLADVIYSPEDIPKYVIAMKALKEFKIEYDQTEQLFNSEVKSKVAKVFGTGEYIKPADNDPLFS